MKAALGAKISKICPDHNTQALTSRPRPLFNTGMFCVFLLPLLSVYLAVSFPTSLPFSFKGMNRKPALGRRSKQFRIVVCYSRQG